MGSLVFWAYLGIVVLLVTLDPQYVFEPPWLLPITNGLFVTGAGVIIAVVAAQGFIRTGSFSILMLGCGNLAFAVAALVAGLVVGPYGPNANVTIYNSGAFIGSLFHLAGALSHLVRWEPPLPRLSAGRKIALAYLLVIAVDLFIALATVMGLMPVFFAQGAGPTLTRQLVLGGAIAVYAATALLFLRNPRFKDSDFLFWYVRGLFFIAAGLFAFFVQTRVGSPLGWSGRVGNYLGSIFLVASLLSVRARARELGTPAEKELDRHFAMPTKLYQLLSIRAWLLLLVVVVTLPAAGGLAWYAARDFDAARDKAYSQVSLVAQSKAAILDLVIRESEALMMAVADLPQLRALDAKGIDPVVRQFMKVHPMMSNLGIRDLHANSVYAYRSLPSKPDEVKQFSWFRAGIESEKFTVGGIFSGRLTGLAVSVLTIPIRDERGTMIGLLNLSINLNKLQQIALNNLPENMLVSVFDPDNRYLMRTVDPEKWVGKELPAALSNVINEKDKGGLFKGAGVDGINRLIASAVVPSSGWRVYAGLPEDVVLGPVRGYFTRLVGVGIAALLLVLALAWRVAYAIAKPISDLATTTGKITAGADSVRARIDGPSEVARVAQEFNRMLDVRQQSEAFLREAEQEFRLLAEAMPQIVWITRADGWNVYFNRQWMEYTGMTLEESYGHGWNKPFHPDDQQRAWDAWEAAVTSHGVYSLECRLRRADGAYLWWLIRGVPVLDENGKILKWFGTCTNINELKRAEMAVRESEEQLRLATEMANIAVWSYDFDAGQMSRSRNHDRLYGLAWQESWHMNTFLDAIHPDDRGRSQEIIGASVAPGGPDEYSLDFRVVWPDQSLHWLWVKGVVSRRDPAGRGLIVRGVLLDITERQQAEAAVRESEEKFSALFHSSPVGIALGSLDGRFVDVNERQCLLLGYAREELIGQKAVNLGIISATERERATLELGHAGSAMSPREVKLRRRDGTFIDVLFSFADIRLRGVQHRLSTILDITERKQAVEKIRQLHQELQHHAAELEERVAMRTSELAAARDHAEAADRVKSAFLATMSHELRTPLNSIIGFTGILLQKLPGDLNVEQEKQLGFVREASRHLLALINDVLDISKVEAGQLSVAHEEFDLHATLQRVSMAFASMAVRRGLAYELQIGDTAAMVSADPRRVEQVLNNLIANAIKFTPSGTITVTLQREAGSFTVTVVDTGVGIKPEDMGKLFRPFSQIETGLPGVREGTGLGLAISRNLVEMMGGHISAESEWGKGSRFAFTLPAGGGQ